MKVALVYDRVNKWGGAERVLLALHEIWPEAPLFTSVYNPQTAPWAKVFKTVPSFLQNFSLAKNNHELFPVVMPFVFESFNFDDYDVVISITSEASKAIVTKPKTLHLCYCLTPTRYLWSGHEQYFKSKLFSFFARPLVSYLRVWDQIVAHRPDHYIAISKTVKERIKKYYGRESEVIFPPVDTDRFRTRNSAHGVMNNERYFLVVSRLVKYKRVDLVVEAFNKLGWSLKIVGTGKELKKLQAKAKKNIEFLGMLTEEELLGYYHNCEGVVFPTEEDFGIVPLEAQAAGKPVIAFKAGGATETVVEDKTGVFFNQQTPQALIKVLEKFDPEKFKARDCQAQAEKFNKERFQKEFKKLVEEKWKDHLKTTYTS
jgi:glycosyltransferase involved in cell wall biosynthesis